ncbi:MAG: hypothetical protein WED83_09655 [Acidimicrobiia bacterium]
MNWETWFTFIVVITVLTVLVLDLLPPSAAMGSGMVAVLVTGVVTPAEALSGFSNPAPVTVAALYVLARAVRPLRRVRHPGSGLPCPGIFETRERGSRGSNFFCWLGVGGRGPTSRRFQAFAHLPASVQALQPSLLSLPHSITAIIKLAAKSPTHAG